MQWFLPDEIEFGYRKLDEEKDKIELFVAMDHGIMIRLVGKQVVKISGLKSTGQIKIKPEILTVGFPDLDLPYRVQGYSKLRKENADGQGQS